MTYNLTVADLAKRLSKVTGLGEPYHARQMRAQIREGALASPIRGGSGPTAPVLFDETGVARAMILHTLAMIGLEMPLLRQAAKASEVLAPWLKKNGFAPSEGVARALWAISSQKDAKMYLHLSVGQWPGDEGEISIGGWVSDQVEPYNVPVAPSLIDISLPLHTVLKPLLEA